MKQHGLLLARHTGRRRQQAHDGTVATLRSNTRPRQSPDCHPSGIGSIASCDRWTATTAGISGELIRDLMIACVERRFEAIRTPHPIQWPSDNGSVYAAARTIELATALGLVPCFTPVESPESNGIAEAFVKTFKRDHVRVNPIPDAATALAAVDRWMIDYHEIHPHSRLAYRSPSEYRPATSQPATCPV